MRLTQFPPPEYESPFSMFLRGVETPPVESRRSDVVYESQEVLAMICSRQISGHEGHSLIIPKKHYASIFDLPTSLGEELLAATQLVCRALVQAFGCDGLTILQNNGRASDQTVFHYHVHAIPRWNGDAFLALYAAHAETQKLMPADQRAALATGLRAAIERELKDRGHRQLK